MRDFHVQYAEKKFQEMMQMMLTTPNWSLKIWKITVEKQLGSWALYIPGMKDSTEIKDTQAHKGTHSETQSL
jgi:hypothetical protein